ncbi:hypothetical protein I302_100671 [Kwoniella bestiolae CBS 10118]|uniref:Uncharacterized protein n=1 Tax=Kwoniella bestiolae CBS 10118 TaxID=1296100 RepID=A0A1B9G5S6_9TREE|nr:hypothetical protein I302_04046 [Kwoniella bestiolae CBS 10118]OCF26363.1 hypothetical protein I302_04046 [Kwoniella bestiolae CBS 10118]
MVSITNSNNGTETGTNPTSITSQQQPDSASSQSQSQSLPFVQNGTSSSLIFQPQPATADVSPTCSTLPRVLEPLRIPQPSLPTEVSPTTPTPPSSTQTVNTGRRNSLATWKIPQLSQTSTSSSFGSSKTKINSKNGTSSNPSTPTNENPNPMNSKTKSNMRPSSSGSRKGKEVIEMATLPITDASAHLGAKQNANAGEERSKEDMAMAKWRKWVVEQPIQNVPDEHSPIRSRRASPSTPIPTGPNGIVASPRMSSLSSPRNGFSPRQPSPAGSPLEPVGSASSSSSSNGGGAGGRYSGFSPRSKSSRLGSGSASGDREYNEVYNTESVMALRDVELAIDEEVLERNERMKHPNGGLQNRRMSTQPRISELPNPFSDIAQRLGSRRVRPIVLELIQALGHYLDAVWCITYPNRPCPWIIGVDESPIPPSVRRMTIAQQTAEQQLSQQMTWKSPMITAVQEGKKTGHVNVPPTIRDVKFWGDEVTFAIRDVDEVVGIYKGVGWAFGAAMRDGVYGAVSSDNVLGVKGEGGGMARLLNDLEEAIWGDAQPRPTDLSYDLPIDFDPYAEPDDQELLLAASIPRGGNTTNNNSGAATRSALADFFGESRTSSNERTPPLPIMEEEIDALPDLVRTEENEEQDNIVVQSPNMSKPRLNNRSNSTLVIPGITDFQGSEDLSLEELGKRRHREWLESQRSRVDAW